MTMVGNGVAEVAQTAIAKLKVKNAPAGREFGSVIASSMGGHDAENDLKFIKGKLTGMGGDVVSITTFNTNKKATIAFKAIVDTHTSFVSYRGIWNTWDSRFESLKKVVLRTFRDSRNETTPQLEREAFLQKLKVSTIRRPHA